MIVPEKVEELLHVLGACGCKKGRSWKGYAVYIPVYSGNPCVGLPYVILEKDGDARICGEDECLEYLDYSDTPPEFLNPERIDKCYICGTEFDTNEDFCPFCEWFYSGVEDKLPPDEENPYNGISVNEAKARYQKGLTVFGKPLPKVKP